MSLLLLCASVTQESIGDIAGSNNLYWFVTNRDIWGVSWRKVFVAIGSPQLVALVERPVRYTALVGPLFVFLGVAWIFATRFAHRKIGTKRFALILLGALPWLWLCKAIAFDWSSTDNLNELIARDAASGLGGGLYLYLLLALVAVTAASLAAPSNLDQRLQALLALLLSLPLGWWLINAGLASDINKYSQTFSGIQFLLGPDRSDRIPAATLFSRWALVQVAATMVFALGAWIGDRTWRSRDLCDRTSKRQDAV